MNRNTNNGTKIKAIDVFMSEKHRAEMALAKLQAAMADHFGCDAEAVHWGHAGTARHCADALVEIVNSLGLDIHS